MSMQTLKVLKGKVLDSRVPLHRHRLHFDALYLNVWHHSLALTVEKGKLSCLTHSVQVQWPWMLHPTPSSPSAPPIKWLMSGEFKECWFKDSIGSHLRYSLSGILLRPFSPGSVAATAQRREGEAALETLRYSLARRQVCNRRRGGEDHTQELYLSRLPQQLPELILSHCCELLTKH